MTQYARFFQVPRSGGGTAIIATHAVSAIVNNPARGKTAEEGKSAVAVLLQNGTAIPVNDMSLEDVWALYQEGCGHHVPIARPADQVIL